MKVACVVKRTMNWGIVALGCFVAVALLTAMGMQLIDDYRAGTLFVGWVHDAAIGFGVGIPLGIAVIGLIKLYEWADRGC